MHWVLIIVIACAQGVSTTSVEFNSEKACLQAAGAIQDSGFGWQRKATCFPKGEE